MAASDSSRSSRNQTPEIPFLPGSVWRTTDFLAAHKDRDLVSDASYNPLAESLTPVATCIGTEVNSIKVKSAVPRISTSQSIIHSSWIQRLKPSSLRCITKESSTSPKKDGFVCTHFTKDYSSCNRHLDSVCHHIRSSSWPPCSNQSENLAPELEEPSRAYTEEPEDAAKSFRALNHSKAGLLSKNIFQSSEAGFRIGSDKACQKPSFNVGSLEPCAQLSPSMRYTSSLGRHLKETNSKNLSNRFGQYHQDCLKDEKNAKSFPRFEPAKSPERLQKSQNTGHLGSCFSVINDFVNAPALPPSRLVAGYCSGAGADADVHYFHPEPIDFGAFGDILVTQSGLGRPDFSVRCSQLDASRNIKKRENFFPLSFTEKEAVQNGMFRGCEGEGDLDLPEYINSHEGTDTTAYWQNAISPLGLWDPKAGACTGGGTRMFDSDLSTFRTSEAKSQNIVSNRLDGSGARSCYLATSLNLEFGEVGETDTLPLSIKSVHEDAASTRICEKSLGDYWNSWLNTVKEPDYGKAAQMGHCQRASSKLEYDPQGNLDEYIFGKPSRAKLKVEDLSTCRRSCKLSNAAKDVSFNNPNDKNRFLSKLLEPTVKVRSDRVSAFEEPRLEASPEKYLGSQKGAPGRGGLQPSNHDSGFYGKAIDARFCQSKILSTNASPKDVDIEMSQKEDFSRSPDDLGTFSRGLRHPSHKVMNNETSGNKRTVHHSWLRRWQSVDRVSHSSEKPLADRNSQIVRSDELSNCANTWRITGIKHKDVSSCRGKIPEFGEERCRYARAYKIPCDSGSASIPWSQSAVQNFSSFRSSYLGSSVKAMAIMGISASTKGNEGFVCLPCAEPQVLEYVPILEDEKNIREERAYIPPT